MAASERSSATRRTERVVSNEGRHGCAVWCPVFDDLQGGLGQPKRLLQQRSIWQIGQPDLKLKHQVVERSQDASTCRFPDDPRLHCTALRIHHVCWQTERLEQRPQCLGKPVHNVSTFSCWHDHGQQGSLADSQHDLDSSGTDQSGVPVAKDRVWGSMLLHRHRIESVQELLGAA